MKNIIFAKTRWNYQSYTDYWKLVELSGFPICYVDEINRYAENTVYVVSPMNGEMHDFMQEHNLYGTKSEIILWNLERPGGSGNIEKFVEDNRNLLGKYFHKIVLSDRNLTKFCQSISNNHNFVYMPLGLHENFGNPGSFDEKTYDLIALACYSSNRSWMFENASKMKEYVYGCSLATNAWEVQRHVSLQLSKFMLNVHQDKYGYIEPLRFILAIAYGLLIITERCYDTYPYDLVSIQLDNMTELTNVVKSYSEYMYDAGLSYRTYMIKNFNFRQIVENTLGEL